MKRILQIISLAGLLLTIVPPVLFFIGNISLATQNMLMLVGAFTWFISAFFWLGKKSKSVE
jgi:high-affinity Fe2+/Pb2+ permease